MALISSLEEESVSRIKYAHSYPGVESASLPAVSALYDYFRYRRTNNPIEPKATIDEQRSILSEIGVQGVNGALIAFGSFTGGDKMEALPWLAPQDVSSHFLYHNYITSDFLVDLPDGVLTEDYPEMIRSFIAVSADARPRLIMHEFDTLALEHKKAISRLSMAQTGLKFSLLESSKGRTRVTDFKPQ
jgi:hypothetical protein